MKVKLHYKAQLILPTLLVALSGCTGSMDDLTAYTEQIRSRPAGKIQPIPEFIPYLNFEYTASEERDPFREVSFREQRQVAASTSNGIQPDADRPKELLEDYPLDTLRMKGTLLVSGELWGLVRAPDSTIHRVKEGQHIGQNFGKIGLVTDEKIDLNEIVPDGLGGYIERSASIALSE
ncbi:MAG: pilus assembly protein PilP [Gammaproteobacteria bacterium]|nr:pilus assembly protein PilP [Gammaproteobacteria bacterium]